MYDEPDDDADGKITADHIQQAVEQAKVDDARLYQDHLAFYRETGETNLIKAAEALGVTCYDEQSYKRIIEAVEFHNAPRRKRIGEQITELGVDRCYVGFYADREQVAGYWTLVYVTEIDLDRYGIRFTVRGRGSDEREADDNAIRELSRFDLDRRPDERPKGHYLPNIYSLPKDWSSRGEWFGVDVISGANSYGALEELYLYPEFFGLEAARAIDANGLVQVIDVDPARVAGGVGDDLRWALGQITPRFEIEDQSALELSLIRCRQGARIADRSVLFGPAPSAQVIVAVDHARAGGNVLIESERVMLRYGRGVLFRPDLLRFEVEPVLEGELVLLSARQRLQ